MPCKHHLRNSLRVGALGTLPTAGSLTGVGVHRAPMPSPDSQGPWCLEHPPWTLPPQAGLWPDCQSWSLGSVCLDSVPRLLSDSGFLSCPSSGRKTILSAGTPEPLPLAQRHVPSGTGVGGRAESLQKLICQQVTQGAQLSASGNGSEEDTTEHG